MLHQEAKAAPSIRVVEGNRLGKDYYIGDIHGNCDLLDAVIKKLGPHDRLFIVGDLTDRGPLSEKVVARIKQINANRATPQIYVTLGNHEQAFLNYFAARKQFYKTRKRKDYEEMLIAYDACVNLEQEWALALDPKIPDHEKRLNDINNTFLSFSSMLHVKETEKVPASTVVHASSPFSHRQLMEKIRKRDFSMTFDQIEYAMWARVMDSDIPIVRHETNPDDPVVYCGHSILDGLRLTGFHINLDTGGYKSNALIMVNHTDGTAELVTTEKGIAEDHEQLAALLKDVNIFLKLSRRLPVYGKLAAQFKRTLGKDEKNPDSELLAAKQKVLLEKWKFEFDRNIRKEAKPADFAESMDQIFLENVALLSKKCTSAQNAILDSACDELVKAFTRDEAKLSKGMKICLTHTKGLGYLADEKNQVVDWNALSFAEKLPLLKIMLTDFPADRWQELRYFTRSIGTPDALMALLGGFSDPEIIQNIVTHFANELVHDAEDAAKLLIAIKAKAPQIDWQKIPVFARVIDSTETLAQFIAHCGEHVPLKELVKFGAQHNEYLLLSSAQAARLLLSLPPEKKSIVPELFHAMESRLVRSTAASNVRAQFVFDVLKACVYGKNGSYIKSDTDMQTANSLLECLYNFLGSVQELLTLALSDEISDKVTKLLRELIFIVESPKGWDVKWRELSAFFMKHYLQFAASKKEDDIFFANGFREVLDKSFNLFHHGDVAVPVSVLSMHDEKLDYKKAVDETRAVLQRIVPAAAKKIHDIMHVKCDMQKFQQLLDLVVHHWLDEKGKRGKTISFFLKDRAAEARKKMHSLNELLTKYHVYVPKSLKKCNAVVHDVARAFVRRM